MVARGAGAVGCAHCKMIGADRACEVCTRLVCERCAADWATCEEPSGRVVKLGLTARVRDVDPAGRFALVSHWRRALRLFDLRQLRWVRGVDIPRGTYLWNRRHPPRLTSDATLIYGRWGAAGRYDSSTRLFEGWTAQHLCSSRVRSLEGDTPEHGTAVANGDLFYYVTATQRVAVCFGPTATEYEPLPRKVVHAVYVDRERSLLAAGSWCELVLHRIVGHRLERVSHAKTESTGDVQWIAVAGMYIAYVVRAFSGTTHLEVRRLERDESIGPVLHRHTGSSFRGASLSRDGRYIAIANTRGLLVREIETDNSTVFDEHTDEINLVRFAGDDHVLVSADTDSRVILRPRTPNGYATALRSMRIPDEPVDLALPQPLEPGPR